MSVTHGVSETETSFILSRDTAPSKLKLLLQAKGKVDILHNYLTTTTFISLWCSVGFLQNIVMLSQQHQIKSYLQIHFL